MSDATATKPVRDVPWHIVGRWKEFEGEERANLLRFVGIAAFYAVELMNYHGLNLGVFQMPKVEHVDRDFHIAVTALAVAWTLVGLGVLVCLRNQVFPAALKFISTGCDVVLLTAILIVADGAKSPMVVGYFLLIALSALRFNLNLVRFATVGSMAGYLVLSGYARWFSQRPFDEIGVPRYHQLIMLLALALTGIVLGQIVRKVYGMAREYAERVDKSAATGG